MARCTRRAAMSRVITAGSVGIELRIVSSHRWILISKVLSILNTPHHQMVWTLQTNPPRHYYLKMVPMDPLHRKGSPGIKTVLYLSQTEVTILQVLFFSVLPNSASRICFKRSALNRAPVKLWCWSLFSGGETKEELRLFSTHILNFSRAATINVKVKMGVYLPAMQLQLLEIAGN